MAEFRYPLTSPDPTTARNNRALMDWLRGNVGDTTDEDTTTGTVLYLNDLQDVSALDPNDEEVIMWDSGSQRYIPSLGVTGPAGADGADGVDGVDGSGSRASMLMLGGM